MASKFFIWTKGDRRNDQPYRVDGLMPVDQYPAEQWDSPADVAACKKRKKKHRPRPLQLSAAGSRSTFDASMTLARPSILHDTTIASVAPASNFLVAVNDMLHSPTFNNPLSSFSEQPGRRRPRSYTAPSTPSIAELPGSILLANQGFPEETKLAEAGQEDFCSAKRSTLTSSLQSAPHVTQHKKILSLDTAMSTWGPNMAAGSSNAVHSRVDQPSSDSASSGNRSSQEKRGDQSENSSLLRSPITETTESPNAFAFAGSDTSNVPAKQPMQQTQVSENEQLKAAVTAQNKQIALLKSQFQHVRISHEAHATTLAEAHRKEMDAIKTYVHYLEESRDSRPQHPHIAIPTRGLRGATPEISPSIGKSLRPSVSDAEATQAEQDNASNMSRVVRGQGSKLWRPSTEGHETVKQLDRKLDLATKHIAAMKDQMEMLMARKDSYKDRAADLEVRVHNNHEMLIDLRESEYKLEMERRLMHERNRQLKRELEALQTQPEQCHIDDLEKTLVEERQRADFLETQLQTVQLRTPIPDTAAELTRTIEDLKTRLEERDEQVYELTHVNQALQLDLEEQDTQQAKLAADHEEALAQETRRRREIKDKVKHLEHENKELKETVEAQGQDMVTVQDEYELLRKLLHSVMRSQAREAISRNIIPGTPCSTDGYLQLVAVEARRRVQALIAKESGQSSYQPLTDPHERIAQLEQEIQHHISELIRCKRDNRGYKKDIKRANTKLDKMRNSTFGVDNNTPQHPRTQSSVERPITPAESPTKQQPDMDGLGIAMTLPSPASSQPTSAVSGSILDSSFPPIPSMAHGRSRSNTGKRLPAYPPLPEQIAENISDITSAPSEPPSNPPPSSSSREAPPSGPRTLRTPITYKLTPSLIKRTPSVNSAQPSTPSVSSIMAHLPSPAIDRPSVQRYYSVNGFAENGNDHNNNNANLSSSGPANPFLQRAATQRSLPEHVIGSYSNTTHTTSVPAISSEDLRPKTSSAADDASNEATSAITDLTALPQRPPSGWKAERRTQEEKLGLMRSIKRNGSVVDVASVMAATKVLRRAATVTASGSGSGKKKAGEGVVGRFNSKGRASTMTRAGTTEGVDMGMRVGEQEGIREKERDGEVVVPIMFERGM